ncbi:ImmA/IrrE family metallo-endopeptidase [Bacillus sp. FJAT-28004]|uniref:ImmA/IrrE family metallo-endopeptidase n=1 Tax=Bacillus sp. FJAT-28004 TaxID=1679165 RepID=UPI0006B55450|nr:ImmA/IrrE family metallo-endopeptidase [Bacillus sp. FJAT-28004]
MHFFNLELYKPSDMELWINKKYQERGIHSATDLNIDNIGALFNTYIAYSEGESKVIYDNDNDCMIFINIHLDAYEQRLAFFHELCHPAMHVGDQRSLSPAFVSLQESQAALFQLYAAMPAYMLEEFKPIQHSSYYLKILSEAFKLPYSFVKQRIEQILGRINRERQDNNLRARSTPAKIKYAYTDTTNRILEQLNKQIANNKER